MICTSSYENCKDSRGVSISGNSGKDAGFCGRSYIKLAPKRNFWKIWKENLGKVSKYESDKYYIHEYYSQVLSKLDPIDVYRDLDGCILLCYEKPYEFCHRHIVACWLEESLKIWVPEVKAPNCTDKIILEYNYEDIRELLKQEMGK